MSTTTAALTEENWKLLLGALDRHRATVSSYDEVLHEVTARAAAAQSVSKADIGALLFWKRLRANTTWASKLHQTPDEQVRERTHAAFLAANDLEVSTPIAADTARGALATLPGFSSGDAMASAVLLALAPTRMAVYDRRAHAAVNKMGLLLGRPPGRYGRYMQVVEDLAAGLTERGRQAGARDVDVALFLLGGTD